MSTTCNFGQIKDLRLKSLCMGSTEVIDRNRNANFRDTQVTNATVKKDLYVEGDTFINGEVIINEDTIICGNLVVKGDFDVGNIDIDILDANCGNISNVRAIFVDQLFGKNSPINVEDSFIIKDTGTDTGHINFENSIIIGDALTEKPSSNVSTNSIIIGKSAIARTPGSIAIGNYANATVYRQSYLGNRPLGHGIAIGTGPSSYYAPKCYGHGSVAIGSYYYGFAGPKVDANNGIAIGVDAQIQGDMSWGGIAIGSYATIAPSGPYNSSVAAMAFGRRAYAREHRSMAIGTYTECYGSYSSAIGYNCYVNAENSLALGPESYVGANEAIAIGYNARVATGTGSISIGGDAGNDSTAGTDNVFIGRRAGIQTSGGSNFRDTVGIGRGVMYYATDISNAIGIGTYALSQADGTAFSVFADKGKEIGIGNNALYYSEGGRNVAVGHESMLFNYTGYNNVAIGWKPLLSNTTGCDNISIGYRSLYNNTTGRLNIAMGYRASFSQVSGQYTIAIGDNALYDNLADNNISIGNFSSAFLTNGTENTVLGFSAGNSLYNDNFNTVIGSYADAGFGNKGTAVGARSYAGFGNECVALGYRSVVFNEKSIGIGGNSYVTGNNGIVIGADSTASANCIVLGQGSTASGDGQFRIGSSSHTISTSGSAGATANWLDIWVNDTQYRIPLHALV